MVDIKKAGAAILGGLAIQATARSFRTPQNSTVANVPTLSATPTMAQATPNVPVNHFDGLISGKTDTHALEPRALPHVPMPEDSKLVFKGVGADKTVGTDGANMHLQDTRNGVDCSMKFLQGDNSTLKVDGGCKDATLSLGNVTATGTNNAHFLVTAKKPDNSTFDYNVTTTLKDNSLKDGKVTETFLKDQQPVTALQANTADGKISLTSTENTVKAEQATTNQGCDGDTNRWAGFGKFACAEHVIGAVATAAVLVYKKIKSNEVATSAGYNI